jgi:hypothetical protein
MPQEGAPADSMTKKGSFCEVLLLFGREVFRRVFLLRCSDFCREGNFPESNCLVFAPGDTGMQSTSGNRFFAPAVFLRQAERHVGVDQLLSLQEI